MPEYKFVCRDMNGKKKPGRLTAASPSDLLSELKGRGLFLLSYEETRPKAQFRKLSHRELAEFCRELGEMLSAGVTVLRAFEIMLRTVTQKRRRAVFEGIYVSLLTGEPLSRAMEAQSPAFPPLLTGMLRAAETNGTLARTALRMAEHYDKEHRLLVKIKSATTYPLVLLVLTVIITTIVFVFVLPRFMQLYGDMELPLPTRVVVGISRVFTQHTAALALGTAAAAVILYAVTHTKRVRLALDRFKLSAPVMGKLNRTIATARFSRTLSSLYASGLPIMQALETSRRTVENTYILSQYDGFLSDVQNGTSLADALEKIDGFDKKLCACAAVGEESGRLESLLLSVADSFDHDSSEAASRLVALLEPALIIIMAVVVGFVMIAVLLPIYNMYSEIDGASMSGFFKALGF